MDKSNEIAGVPLEIHFIWAGGDKPLPIENMETIALWAIKNCEFKISLWVDEKTSSAKFDQFNIQYQESFKAAYLKVCGNKDAVVPNVLKVRDIRQEGICREGDIADYELTRLLPNFGASSDILRYRILVKFGGVYADSDVAPSKNPLVWILNEMSKVSGPNKSYSHFLCLNNFSQVTPHTLKTKPEIVDTFERLANDAFICTSGGNPLAMQLVKIVEHENYMLRSRYREEASEITLKMITNVAYFSHNKKLLTIAMTGPDALATVLHENRFGVLKQRPNLHKTVVVNEKRTDVLIVPLASRYYQIVEPVLESKEKTDFISPNRSSWLENTFQLRQLKSMRDIYESILKTILFEQEHFGCLRLADHLRTINKACEYFRTDPNTSCKEFVQLLSERNIIDTESLYCVQLCNLNPLVSEFYDRNQLSEKTQLLSKQSKHIFDCVTSFTELSSGCCEMTTLNDSTISASEWKNMVLDTMPSQEASNIFDKIDIGLDFMEMLIENQGLYCEKYPMNNLEQMLQRYTLILNKGVELSKELQISPELIGNLNSTIENLLSRIKAIPTYKEALKTINSQGISLFKKEQFSESFTVFQSALPDASKILGRNSDEVATLLYNMSSCLIRQGKSQEAIPLLEECAEIRQRVFGKEHQQTIKTHQKLDETRSGIAQKHL